MITRLKTTLQAFTLLALLLLYASEGMAGTPLVNIVQDPTNPTTIGPNVSITVKYFITNNAFTAGQLLIANTTSHDLAHVTIDHTNTTCSMVGTYTIFLDKNDMCTLAFTITAGNVVTKDAYINFEICAGTQCSKTAEDHAWQPTSVPATGSLFVTPSTPQIVTVNDTTGVTLTITAVGKSSTVTVTKPNTWASGVSTTTDCPTPTVNLTENTSCTYTITSNQPNLAGNVSITGSNNTTTLVPIAFRQNAGLVFSVAGTTAIVVSETDIATNKTQSEAVQSCLSSGVTLPSICQLGVYDRNAGGENAGCDTNIQNVDINLYQLGFLPDLNGTLGGYYWSNTPYRTESNVSWVQFFYRNGEDFTNSSQGPFNANSLRSVRCVYSYTF
jgi:hypothetical protein